MQGLKQAVRMSQMSLQNTGAGKKTAIEVSNACGFAKSLKQMLLAPKVPPQKPSDGNTTSHMETVPSLSGQTVTHL
jgi:hypothetical protein